MTQLTKILYLCTVVQQIKQIKTKNNYEKTKFCNPARHVHIHGGGKSYAHDIEVANADGVTIYYNFINDKTELGVTYKGTTMVNADYAGKVVIPESVIYEGKTYFVTTIGSYAFHSCRSLTEVTIPSSAIYIGGWTFFDCSGLKEVIIGNSVTSIGDYAFSGCSSLTELTIPSSVIYINDRAFFGCEGLTKLTIPNSVTYIGNFAFSLCIGLTELIIPNSVTTIGRNAFDNCSGLTELTIPNSVTSIGIQAFYGCSGLEKITVESDNPNYDSRENCNAIIATNRDELIAGCKNTIIPNSVTSIGDDAFSGSIGLTKLTIGNSVTSIGDGAFSWCEGLTEVTIGNSVTSIGDYAFYQCTGLTTLYSLNTTPPIVAKTSTFENNHYRNLDVFVPQEALETYQTADIWKNFQKLQGFNVTGVVKAKAAAEQIQTANGQIIVTGLTDGTTVTVYDLSGKLVGSATSKGEQATVNTGMTAGATVIVKTGEKSVKTVMK